MNLDRIHISDLLVRCVIGIRDWERREKQNVMLNIILEADLSVAGRSDAIADTVDYVTIKKRVMAMAEASAFKLIERLAQAVADSCLEDERVSRVTVRAEKPGAIRFARTVAVEITRTRDG